MTSYELPLHRAAAANSAAGVAPTARRSRPATDYAVVVGAWVLVVLLAAVGFGAVIVIDVYGLLWLAGRRTLVELVDLDTAAHTVIAVGVGGLLASGIALQPDLTTPPARFKMLLVLVLMLNGLAAQRFLIGLRKRVPPGTRGASIPWAAFQRGLAAALVSQASWWGAIAIGFITNAARH
jgi:hypothetical protein